MSKLRSKKTQRILDLTEDEFTKEINEYFMLAEENDKPFLNIGLANHLNISKDAIHDIKAGRLKSFEGTYHKEVLEWASSKCEQYLSEKLFDKNAKSVTGAIFTLKCNYGWSEKQQIDLNHNGTINISFE